jgi:hypothetical protein
MSEWNEPVIRGTVIALSVKVKQSTTHLWRCRGERWHSSYLFMTRWGWVVSVTPSPPFRLVPIGQEAKWAPEPVWTQRLEEKLFRLFQGSNLDCPVVQSVARHYIDWGTPAPSILYNKLNKFSLYLLCIQNNTWVLYFLVYKVLIRDLKFDTTEHEIRMICDVLCLELFAVFLPKLT